MLQKLLNTITGKKEKKQSPTSANESPDRENSGQTNPSEQIIKRTNVPNTPFVIVTLDNGMHFIACGKYRLTEPTTNINDLHKKIQVKTWDLITTLITVSCEWIITEEEKKKIPTLGKTNKL